MNSTPFLWGVSTSAFQIEGDIQNDVTDWENSGHFKSKDFDPRYGQAADHWNRWQDDFGLLKQLGVNSYRFSVEWARIEPERGSFNEKAINQYSRMIDKLLELGITPMLTLHHFTHPRWFHENSPWHKPQSVADFSSFTRKVVERLGDRVPYFITINEPMVWLLAGYLDGKFPPGRKNIRQMSDALHNMLLAHAQAYNIIKEKNSRAQVGIAQNFIVFKSARKWNPLDQKIKRLIHEFYNMSIPTAFRLNRIKFSFPFIIDFDKPIDLNDKIDFWGINYYYRMHVRFQLRWKYPFELQFQNRSGSGLSDLGWEIYARGLTRVLNWLKPTGKPLFITENGIAVDDDSRRVEYMKEHLSRLRDAISANPQVRGYFHWSLMDNYEWLVGYTARFGLYEVDFQNGLKRSIRPSGEFYAEWIKNSL